MNWRRRNKDNPQQDPQRIMIEILKEMRDSLNTISNKLDTMNTNLSNKLDTVSNKLDRMGEKITKEIREIPNRMVQELYGNQTVRWGPLGYKPAQIKNR